MVATETPMCEFGRKAVSFELPDTEGRLWSLEDCRGERGTVVMFICNHCPFVQAVIDRLVADMRELADNGTGAVAIMSNDWTTHPADAPEHMQNLAAEKDFSFPYLVDESQEVARAYGAVCTPDFYGYNADLQLQYRGRLDSGGRDPDPGDVRRELVEAMLEIGRTGGGPARQNPSIGCSIKWRSAA